MLATERTGRPFSAERVNWNNINTEPYWIYNKQPYGRRVDTQYVGLKKLRFRTPPGLYEDAVTAIRARFGHFVTAYRRYTITIPDQYIIKRGFKAGKPVEVPAILISPKE
jgi:hypothetical protein